MTLLNHFPSRFDSVSMLLLLRVEGNHDKVVDENSNNVSSPSRGGLAGKLQQLLTPTRHRLSVRRAASVDDRRARGGGGAVGRRVSEHRQSRKVAETILRAKEKLVNATSEVKAVTSPSASVCEGADMDVNTVTVQSRNQSGSVMLLFYNQTKSDKRAKINDLVKASRSTTSRCFYHLQMVRYSSFCGWKTSAFELHIKLLMAFSQSSLSVGSDLDPTDTPTSTYPLRRSWDANQEGAGLEVELI